MKPRHKWRVELTEPSDSDCAAWATLLRLICTMEGTGQLSSQTSEIALFVIAYTLPL